MKCKGDDFIIFIHAKAEIEINFLKHRELGKEMKNPCCAP